MVAQKTSCVWKTAALLGLIALLAMGGCAFQEGSPTSLPEPTATDPALESDLGTPNQDRVVIESVQIDQNTGLLVVGGSTTLADGQCILTELWSHGEPAAWWPAETCADLQGGAWQIEVALGEGDAPKALDTEATHMVRAFQRNGPDVQSTFALELGGPPTPKP